MLWGNVWIAKFGAYFMMFVSKVKKEKELLIYKGNIKITRRKLITKKKRVDNCIKNYQVKRINSRRRYKGSIQEEDITITNIYAPNIGALHV